MADEAEGDPSARRPFWERGRFRRKPPPAPPVPSRPTEKEQARHTLNQFVELIDRQEAEPGPASESHVDDARYLTGPWVQLGSRQRDQLVEFFPKQIRNSVYVPAAVRAYAHSLARRRKLLDSSGEPISSAEWRLRDTYGKIYGTGDPATASAAIVHISYPFGEMAEELTYDALRGILGENQVGVMIVIPRRDEETRRNSEMEVVQDFFHAAALEFPNTSLIVSSHESLRLRWTFKTDLLRKERREADINSDLSYEPVLATVAGLAEQSRSFGRIGAARSTRSGSFGVPNMWVASEVSGKGPGNFGTTRPGLN